MLLLLGESGEGDDPSEALVQGYWMVMVEGVLPCGAYVVVPCSERFVENTAFSLLDQMTLGIGPSNVSKLNCLKQNYTASKFKQANKAAAVKIYN